MTLTAFAKWDLAVAKVYVIAYEGCYAGSLSNPQDLYMVANAHWREQYQGQEGEFEWQTLSLGGATVVTASHLRIAVDGPLLDLEAGSIIVVPAMAYPGGRELNKKLESLREIINWLVKQYANNCIICTHCTGSFILAESGLLNGHSATTSWWLAEQFRQRYPEITLKADQLVVDEGRLLTGGANGAEMLAALIMVERYMGRAVASQCARTLLVDTNLTQQAPYLILPRQKQHSDSLMLEIQDYLEKNLSDAFSLAGLAQRFCISSRTLMRRFKEAVGDTPNSYLQNLRIEAAKKLFEATSLSTDAVMLRIGYADTSSFNRLFQRKTGLSPRAYRLKFGSVQRSEQSV
ncbi:MAG: helix-turn-helix domain-containing protein [Zhongshania sp.]|uniref:GlxA family transcriptional regulator n=1 Tax=Zhongshania sp. TaxID=1971902 RepID=UPI00260EE095|nr:helix-turn-helix domain-containing protein [Zhongshania sp.]MDF1692883.1 helix-turn-helix domain-containing protein [Zhongshania sp.]